MRPSRGVPFIAAPVPPLDSKWAGTPFGDYCQRGRAKHGARFIAPTEAKWIEAYNKGPRYCVQVRTVYGTQGDTRLRWGYVALTTGWIPSFMLKSRASARGSDDLVSSTDEIVGSKWV